MTNTLKLYIEFSYCAELVNEHASINMNIVIYRLKYIYVNDNFDKYDAEFW